MYFIPNGKAEEFIKGFAQDKTINIFCGGNGSGKTTLLVNMLANICYEPNKDWFDYPIFHNWPHLKLIRIISDPTTITDKMIPEMRKWFPRGRYTTAKEKKSYDYRWTTDTGFTITLMTYDQDIKEFESVDLGLVLMDEPPPEAIFNASFARLRLGGKCALFMTPLASAAYIFEKFIQNTPQGYDADNKAFYVYVDIEDNCRTHGTRGFLQHEKIAELETLYDDDEKEARLHGKFVGLIGLIYGMFRRDKHVVTSFPEVAKDWAYNSWTVYWDIDTHPVVNTHVMFMALLSDNRKVIIDEIWHGAETNVIASEIHEKLKGFKKLGGRISNVGLIDPSAVIQDKLRGKESIINDFIKEWRKLGADYKLIPASKDRDRGEDLVKQELRGTINPNLYICSNVKYTLWEVNRYGIDPKTKKRVDKDDHAMENLYRLIISHPHQMFTSTKKEKAEKIIKGLGTT